MICNFTFLSFRLYQDDVNKRCNYINGEAVVGKYMRFLRNECSSNKHFGKDCLGKCPVTPKQTTGQVRLRIKKGKMSSLGVFAHYSNIPSFI